MGFDFDGLGLAESLLGLAPPTLQLALLGVGAALFLSAVFWPKRKGASVSPADAQLSPARAPERKFVA